MRATDLKPSRKVSNERFPLAEVEGEVPGYLHRYAEERVAWLSGRSQGRSSR